MKNLAPFSGFAGMLIAFGVLLGLQCCRAVFPLLVYIAQDRFGLPSTALGGIGIALFGTSFLLPALQRRTTDVGALRTAVAFLLVFRGTLQVWPGDPVGSLVLAAGGVVSFLAVLAAAARLGGRGPIAPWLLLGAIADVAIHALAGTRDLHWGGIAASISFLALALVGLGLIIRVTEEALAAAAHDLRADHTTLAPTQWIIFGPWLLLQLEVLGNVARLSAATGWSTAVAGAVAAFGLAFSAAAVVLGPAQVKTLSSALGATILLSIGLVSLEDGGIAAAGGVVGMQLAVGLLLGRGFRQEATPRVGRSATMFGLGFLGFILLAFLHYAGYDLPLPGSRGLWWGIAGLGVAVPALFGSTPGLARPEIARPVVLAGIAFALLPLLRREAPPPSPAPPGPQVRVVTFNLHNAFDERGGFALDSMIARLKNEQPDLIALQEVSRGWLVNGCADLFELCRHELQMEGYHGPAISRDWGNAVFGRFAADSVRRVALPPFDLPLTRQALIVDYPATPHGTPLRIIATHWHHRGEDEHVRVIQAEETAGWGDAPAGGILLGDFNALPDSESLAILKAAGWRDVGAADPGPFSPTYPSDDPARRIDTIFLGGGSETLRTRVAPPWGSDHRAVIADVRP